MQPVYRIRNHHRLSALASPLQRRRHVPRQHGRRATGRRSDRGVEAKRARARRIGYAAAVRTAPLGAYSLIVYALGCGQTSTHSIPSGVAGGEAGASAGPGGGPAAGGMCSEPEFAVPKLPPFQAPTSGARGKFQVTFQNRCAETLWPAWGSANGLDNSVIDPQLWLPLMPASDRAVTVYGGVRMIGFWGRTGCSFDQDGVGSCQTGDCGGFICPISVDAFPKSATIFVLQRGFLDGYNVSLLVEGTACGSHQCVADVNACSPGAAIADSCGKTIACADLCSGSASGCCSQTRSPCDAGEFDDTPESDDLVLTFCP